jgi:hypothetical protein
LPSGSPYTWVDSRLPSAVRTVYFKFFPLTLPAAGPARRRHSLQHASAVPATEDSQRRLSPYLADRPGAIVPAGVPPRWQWPWR